MANGVTADGAPYSQNTYQRPTSEKVFVLMIHFDSPEHAKKQFEEKVNKAAKIIE